ncbi:MAG: hypothetical protein J1G06_06510 [Oscillospiraceae bacterium]|nr:hypothetical protein [Oscillospiraceae bacterium]
MKHYKRSDRNIPMKFYKFYVFTSLPLFMALAIVHIQIFIIIKIYDINRVSSLLLMVELLIAICAYFGLHKEKYWGYIINEILVIVEAIIGFALSVFGIYRLYSGYTGGAEILAVGIAIMIPNILMFIYFEKRRHLFKDVLNMFDAPIYTYAAEACYISTLHLNGTTSERIGALSEFNFNYSKFLDKNTGTIYFREEVRNGQTVNVAVTREKWKEAVAQQSALRRSNTTD